MTLTVGEPLGDVSGSANHDFRTSVTRISSEIDASKKLSFQLASLRKNVTGTFHEFFFFKFQEVFKTGKLPDLEKVLVVSILPLTAK